MNRLWRFAATILLLCLPRPLPAGEAPPAPELDFVPPDATAFVHVRLADLWQSDLFSFYRATFEKAGPKLLESFNKRYLSLPANLERLTGYVTVENDQPKEAAMLLVVREPLDPAAIAERFLPGAKPKMVGTAKVWTEPREQLELSFPSPKILALTTPGGAARLQQGARRGQGIMSEAIALAQRKAFVGAFNLSAIPLSDKREIPPILQPLTKARLAFGALDPQRGDVELRLSFADKEQVQDAEKALQAGLQMVKGMLAQPRREIERKAEALTKGTLEELPESVGVLMALGWFHRIDEFMAHIPLQKKGNNLQLAFPLPKAGAEVMASSAVLIALLLPAVQKVREAAGRTQAMNNLKQIALAMHVYHDAKNTFPAAAICDKNGRPLLSWRVALLPYLEHDTLYKQFKLDEPWDSEHNRKLMAQMPEVFKDPMLATPPGETNFRVFVGGGAGFELDKGTRIADITDGTSNTLMVVEASKSVPWTKPDELKYDPTGPLPELARVHTGNALVAFFDGSVRLLSGSLPQATLRATITRAGGEVVNLP